MQYLKKNISAFFCIFCLIILSSASQLCATFVAYSKPQIVQDSTGNQIAVFLQQDEFSNFVVMGSTWDSTNGWSTPVVISTSTRNAFKPIITINSSDQVLASWGALDATAGTDYIEAITYSSTFTNGWGSIATVSNGTDDAAFGDQRMILDNSGNMTLMWTAFNSSGDQSIKSSTSTFAANPTWTTEVTIAQGSGS